MAAYNRRGCRLTVNVLLDSRELVEGALASLCAGTGPVTIDIESTGLSPVVDKIDGVAVHDPETGTSYYLPVSHLYTRNASPEEFMGLHDAIVHRQWIAHNAKFDGAFLVRDGWSRYPDHCTMIMVKVIDFTRQAGLKALSEARGVDQQHFEELVDYKSGHNISELPASRCLSYVCDDVEQCWITYVEESAKLATLPQAEIYMLELRVLPFVGEMEVEGILVDTAELEKVGVFFGANTDEITPRLWAKFKEALGCPGPALCRAPCTEANPGCEFIIHSPKKLSLMLYKYLGLAPQGKRPKVKPGKSANEGSVDKVAITLLAASTGFEWVNWINDYKEALKAKGMAKTFIDAVGIDGKIHTTFGQVRAISGRFSSASPNLQQVPAHPSKWAKAPLPRDVMEAIGLDPDLPVPTFRGAFNAGPGRYLLSIDYSQIEMRIFAVMAQVMALVNGFNAGLDAHSNTASIIYDVPIERVTEEQRTRSKTMGFGMIYGMTESGLSNKLNILQAEGKRIYARFFEAIPEFRRFLTATHEFCARYGGVYTQYGRWVPIPDINDRAQNIRSKAERLSVNARIQGSAADVMKVAIARVGTFLRSRGNDDIKMLLTVHDELVFSVSDAISPLEAFNMLSPYMVTKFGTLELTVDAEYGSAWGLMESHPR